MEARTDLGAKTCRALDLVDVSFELDALECFCKQVRLLIHGGDFDWSYLPVLDLLIDELMLNVNVLASPRRSIGGTHCNCTAVVDM
jgi:hypothetical protein